MDKNENQEDDVQGTELQKVDETPQEIETRQAQEQRKEFLMQMEKFTKSLNSKPSKVAQHKQGHLYVPVSSIEKDLAKMFFGLVQYEILGYSQVFNEVLVTARIKVFHPVIQQWLNYDGAGSAVIQQDANTKVQDFHIFKKPNAMQLTFPKAYAEAIKNAAKKIGKRFGSDLNRQLEDDYQGFIKEEPKDVQDPEIINK